MQIVLINSILIINFEVINEEDEDSNDEGNWRNDYPDEDEYYDDDIDEENDEEGRSYNHSRRPNYNDEEEYDDNYDEYNNGTLKLTFSDHKKNKLFL